MNYILFLVDPRLPAPMPVLGERDGDGMKIFTEAELSEYVVTNRPDEPAVFKCVGIDQLKTYDTQATKITPVTLNDNFVIPIFHDFTVAPEQVDTGR